MTLVKEAGVTAVYIASGHWIACHLVELDVWW